MFYENYKNIIFFRFTLYSNICLNSFSNKSYFWLDSTYSSTFSTLNKFDLSSDFDDTIFSHKNSVLRLVYFKKRFGFFKKNNKINHFYLYKTNFLKNQSLSKFDSFEIDLDSKNFNKFFDFKSSTFSVFFNNRKLLKKLFFLKNMRQKKTTKLFSKLIKSDFKSFVKFIEYSLYNILIKSKMCYTYSESIFLIKNGFVFVNGLLIKNPFFLLKNSDIIQITISDQFYEFFKINTDKKYKLVCLLKHIIWKNHRFLNNFYKQSYNRVPDWVFDTSSFYEDVPSYIDVDYTTMSLCILKLDVNFIFYNNNFLNFINIFMLRNYNWNYLV